MTVAFCYDELIKAAGIKQGMTIDIVIDLFNVIMQCKANGQRFEAQEFIDALKNAVGNNGNVLIRTFNWDWCHGKGFNAKTTASQVGSLGNVAMKRLDFKRTRHPIYSWMVWGKNQNYLCNLDYVESFDERSIFAWEEKNKDAYQVNIGNPQVVGLTLFHYVEKEVGVSYRYIKNFTDSYTDENGITSEKTYSMYVRDLDYQIETVFSVYDDLLLKKGIMKKMFYEGIDITSYKIQELCATYVEDIKKNGKPSGVSLVPLQDRKYGMNYPKGAENLNE